MWVTLILIPNLEIFEELMILLSGNMYTPLVSEKIMGVENIISPGTL